LNDLPAGFSKAGFNSIYRFTSGVKEHDRQETQLGSC